MSAAAWRELPVALPVQSAPALHRWPIANSIRVKGYQMTVWFCDQGEDLEIFATEEIAQA
jgi:hypothetical protein